MRLQEVLKMLLLCFHFYQHFIFSQNDHSRGNATIMLQSNYQMKDRNVISVVLNPALILYSKQHISVKNKPKKTKTRIYFYLFVEE